MGKIKIICKNCEIEKYVFPCKIKRNRGKFCSFDCRVIYQRKCHGLNEYVFKKGHQHSKEVLKKISESNKGHPAPPNAFKKGMIPWNKGVPMTKDLKNKLSESHKGKYQEKNPAWKGDKAGYTALHRYAKIHWGKAYKCDFMECIYPRKNSRGIILLIPNLFTWSNISGKYKRERSDWRMACMSCHMKWDRKNIPGAKNKIFDKNGKRKKN